MNNRQDLLNEMVSKRNFKKYVDICFREGFKIENLEFAPDIPLYFNDTWAKINFNNKDIEITFIVKGQVMSGVENFYKHYKEITNFKKTYTFDGQTYISSFDVIPYLVDGNQWYIDEKTDVDGHFEISYSLHSVGGPAYIKTCDGEMYDEKYIIDGDELEYEVWLQENREKKLKRVLKKKENEVSYTEESESYETFLDNGYITYKKNMIIA